MELVGEKPSQIYKLTMVEVWKNKILKQNHTYLLHKGEIPVLGYFLVILSFKEKVAS